MARGEVEGRPGRTRAAPEHPLVLLCLDREEMDTMMLREVAEFGQATWQVLYAPTAVEARELLRSRPADVILVSPFVQDPDWQQLVTELDRHALTLVWGGVRASEPHNSGRPVVEKPTSIEACQQLLYALERRLHGRD